MTKNIILIDNRPGQLAQVGDEASSIFYTNPEIEGILFKEPGLSHYIPRDGVVENRREILKRIPNADKNVD